MQENRKEFDNTEHTLVIEGRNAVLEAFRSGKPIDKVFVLDGCQDGPVRTIVREAKKHDTIINFVGKERLSQISVTGKHQGVIAYAAAYEYSEVEDMLKLAEERGEDPFLILLDNIEDPHNLGAIIRTANLAGAHGVIIPKRRAVGLTATVAKTSAGALNYTPVAKVTNLAKTMEELKEKFRNLDVLLIDDIQSLAKKTLSGTQEEFFNTFNALYDNNKQIVLTSDRTPDHLDNLEQRLVTRFKWGLTINITPPDFETRVAILTNKTQEYDFVFPQDTIEYLAGQFDSNVRDLEGALKDISLVASIKKVQTITVDIAAEAVRARKQDGPKMTVIPIDEIQSQVGKFYGVTVKEIKATKRTQDIVLARQVAMYLAREMTDNSLPKIGKEFGGRDHSTVLHAYNKIKNMLAQDDSLRIEIETIKNKIR